MTRSHSCRARARAGPSATPVGTVSSRGIWPDPKVLEAAHCWEESDRAGTPAMTDFRRALRYHQARWREAQGFPIGTLPIVPQPGKPWRLVGSRLPLDFAKESGANLLTGRARTAAIARSETVERHQSFDTQRLWADPLSPMALCFNLFGDLAADLRLADAAVHRWWPDTPGTVKDVRFAHSPGRLDPAYLGNLGSFDVAFILELGDGTDGILGLVTRYHERVERRLPKPARLPRYIEITERSGAFAPERSRRSTAPGCSRCGSTTCSSSPCCSTNPGGGAGVASCRSTRRGTSTSSMPAPAMASCSSTLDLRIGEHRGSPRRGALPKTTTTRFRRRYLPD